MLVPKQARIKVYTYLFKEGVMVAKKDFNAAKHTEVDVRNLYVIKLMQSLRSRGYVKEQFNWQYFYWVLTNEGIEYLRKYLYLPEEIVPNTLKKPKTPTPAPSQGREGREGKGPVDRTGAKKPEGGEKKVGAPGGDFKPDFRGGFGRGRGGRDSYRKDQPSSGRGGARQ